MSIGVGTRVKIVNPHYIEKFEEGNWPLTGTVTSIVPDRAEVGQSRPYTVLMDTQKHADAWSEGDIEII